MTRTRTEGLYLDTRDEFVMWVAAQCGGTFEGDIDHGWRFYRFAT